MGKVVLATALCLIIGILGSASWAMGTATTPEEVTTWTRLTVPLPKSIEIPRKVQVQCAQVAIVTDLRTPSTDIKIAQAVKELRLALGLPADGPNPASPSFTITLQLGEDPSDLAGLANSDQAYKIVPEANDTGLRLIALQPAGLYYAAKTLCQMLPWGVSGGNVKVPMASIKDWPDMADRGLWGCDHFLWLKWMSDCKMNIGEQISARSVTSDGKGHSELKAGRETMVTEGPYYNVKPVPATLHLEQVSGSGLFTYYPQVIGVGGQPGCICYSNGAFTHVLADWIVDLASLPHVNEVDVWMAENLHGQGGCKCAQCSLVDRNVLEAQVIVAAWNEAKTRLGRYIGLYILTSEETESSNRDVFAALPVDVRVWYYHSLYTYTTGRCDMVSRDLKSIADAGRYAGVCPSISVVGCSQPFSSAETMHYRMNEFVDKGIDGYIGYSTPPPLVPFIGYNTEASAEWAWNAKGRSPREFAAAYAVRKGYQNAEKFADWADAIGRVELDVYGSNWPDCEGRSTPGYVADCLQEGSLPGLGTVYPGFRGPWGEFTSAKQFDDDVLLAAKALAISKDMGIDEYYYESLYVNGLVNALRALYKLKPLVVGGTVSEANRETARYHFGVYVNSLKQSIDAVKKWCVVVNGESGSVGTVVAKLQNAIDGQTGTPNPGMLAVAAAAGCSPNLPFSNEPAMTIADAKIKGAGTLVNLYGELVTGGNGTTRFLQERNRTIGIRVKTSTALPDFSNAIVVGSVENSNGELVVNADVVQSLGAAESVAPIAMSLRSLAGGTFGGQPAVMEYRKVKEGTVWVRRLLPADGLNNLGLFVRVTALVSYVGADYIYVDDGSKLDDDSGHFGIRVLCPDASWVKPEVGDVVTINCMSSAYFERGNTWRALYVPVATNIVITPVPFEIIIDEDQATCTGDWTYIGAGSGSYQDDCKVVTSVATETATARYTPNIPRSGNYDVYVMHSDGTDRTLSAAYTISYDGGTEGWDVNQSIGGGTWLLLGRKKFAAGATGYVQLGNSTPDPGKTVSADAVKFVFMGGGTPPAVTGQPTDQVVCMGTTATFTTVSSGSLPLSFQWRKGTVNVIDDGHFSGATSPTLSVDNCTLADAASNFNCVVNNNYGTAWSGDAKLMVADPTATPAALSATNIGTDAITWNWGAVTGATGYKLWTAATGGTQVGGTITGTSYTQTKLDPAAPYNLYAEAITGCGASATRTQLGPITTMPRYCVENSDFEDGFTAGIGNHWFKAGDDSTSTFAREATIKRDGASSQKLVDPVGLPSTTAYLCQRLNVKPGGVYILKVWNRREVASGAAVYIGCDVNGGLSPSNSSTFGAGGGVWSLKSKEFTAGPGGLVTIVFCAGNNKNDSVAYIDGVYVVPKAPTASGGTATISAGGSATITASGGFGGTSSEMHWYTGAAGTGIHVGTGTSLVVSPTTTTTYYPRWESSLSGSCPSDDGASVTITVN